MTTPSRTASPKAMLVLAAVALAPAAHAQMYKCSVDGRTTFSDQPCSTQAVQIEVRPARGADGIHAPASTTQAAAQRAPAADETAAVDRRIKQRQIRNEIDFQESRLAQVNRRRDAELEELRAEQLRANNNLAGATYRQSISQEMGAVTARYDSEARVIESEIAILRASLANIN